MVHNELLVVLEHLEDDNRPRCLSVHFGSDLHLEGPGAMLADLRMHSAARPSVLPICDVLFVYLLYAAPGSVVSRDGRGQVGDKPALIWLAPLAEPLLHVYIASVACK
jgi:hypothetical protein